MLLAAFALLGGQALSTLHYVLVPHHLCAEHGVLEDGGARVKSAAGEPGRHTGVSEASERDDQDQHESCSVATRHEQDLAVERPALERTHLTQTGRVGAGPGAAPELKRAVLLSRAPKTSPPSPA